MDAATLDVEAVEADLGRLLVKQQRLVIAGRSLKGRLDDADALLARLIAADLSDISAALDRLAQATGAAVGSAVANRAASLAYLSVGRVRPH
jgi:hypothetical protein